MASKVRKMASSSATYSSGRSTSMRRSKFFSFTNETVTESCRSAVPFEITRNEG